MIWECMSLAIRVAGIMQGICLVSIWHSAVPLGERETDPPFGEKRISDVKLQILLDIQKSRNFFEKFLPPWMHARVSSFHLLSFVGRKELRLDFCLKKV